MLNNLHLGIIRESKSPPDTRVVLTPDHCVQIMHLYPSINISVQSSTDRCFTDDEYLRKGIKIVNNLTHCDIILGVKEISLESLLPNKTYFFFSHTIKEQPYNRSLFKKLSTLKITLIDYEVLQKEGIRVIAFGKFAGIVGAYNALYTYGRRSGEYELSRMFTYHGFKEVVNKANTVDFPNFKIVLTGSGRVAGGAEEMLNAINIRKVTPEEFLDQDFDEPVFTQLSPKYYAKSKDKEPFDLREFYSHPEKFETAFIPYSKRADIFINGIYWDPKAPSFFTLNQMKEPDFRIKVISDITCDIAPESSVPSTLRATTIEDPIFGFDPSLGKETLPFSLQSIDMTTIDNLPNELPRDSSISFGDQFIQSVLPELVQENESSMIEKATLLKKGKLTVYFEYLRDYLEN